MLYYNLAEIGKFEIGCVVVEKEGADVGHVVGFGRNPSKEILVSVKWSSGETLLYHPTNIKLVFKGN